MKNEIVLLKLGGSLITDKDLPYTPRLDLIGRLAQEIKTALSSHPELTLILGHGSGSFGHVEAQKHGTRNGVHTPSQWMGFAEVRFQAAALNRFIMQALLDAGVPAIAFPPSSCLVSSHGHVTSHQFVPLHKALQARLLPVIYGDVVFDEQRGGTILSTEEVFRFLTAQFSPGRILLAGMEAGVWQDFPARTRLVKQIQVSDYEKMRDGIQGSASTDVTGGMKTKVEDMLVLIQQTEGLTVQIFSAEPPGNLKRALQGECVGTILSA